MFTPRLGVSLHCVQPSIDGELLNALAQSQVATLELATLELAPKLFGDDPATRTALRATMLTSGIRAATVHAPFGGSIDVSSLDDGIRQRGTMVWRDSLELASDFEAGMVVLHASAEPVGDDERAQRMDRVRETLASVADRCRELRLRATVELLPRSCLGNTTDELIEIIADLDPRIFGVCLDVNHLMDRPHTLADVVHKLGDRLFTLHLSDYDGVDEKHWMPGDGVLDWSSLMAALDEIDYDGPFNYEAKISGDTPGERLAELQRNFAWLLSLR